MSGSKQIEWRSRIVGHGEQPANQFLASPWNFRRHPGAQRDALRGSLGELGWIAAVIVNRATGNLIDGHARIEEALSLDEETLVPFLEVELSEAEEKLALSLLDPIGAMAVTDKSALDALLREVNTGDQALQTMLGEMAQKEGLYKEAYNLIPDDGARAKEDAPPPVSAERYPLAIVLTKQQQQRWNECRTMLGAASDTAALVAAMEVVLGG